MAPVYYSKPSGGDLYLLVEEISVWRCLFSAPAASQGLVKRTPEIAVSVWGQASNIALAVVTLV